jgi:3-oxoacid CoA-transferase subunit A
MIYITGDTHRDKMNFKDILSFCEHTNTSKNDFMIITGDVGINYFIDSTDKQFKSFLEACPITFLMVRGNHEERPENIPSYTLKYIDKENFKGNVSIESDYPSLYFLDNGLYEIEGKTFYNINGAYSIDKYIRLEYGMKWFPDEELSGSEMIKILDDIHNIKQVDFVTSHTCPSKFIPIETFTTDINPNQISRKMENLLNEVEEQLTYDKWYCGHWHIDKDNEKICFLFNNIEQMA